MRLVHLLLHCLLLSLLMVTSRSLLGSWLLVVDVHNNSDEDDDKEDDDVEQEDKHRSEKKKKCNVLNKTVLDKLVS